MAETVETCPNCEGDGYTIEVEPRCCGRSQWECGGRGCAGPEPEQVQEQCRLCCGIGHIEAEKQNG